MRFNDNPAPIFIRDQCSFQPTNQEEKLTLFCDFWELSCYRLFNSFCWIVIYQDDEDMDNLYQLFLIGAWKMNTANQTQPSDMVIEPQRPIFNCVKILWDGDPYLICANEAEAEGLIKMIQPRLPNTILSIVPAYITDIQFWPSTEDYQLCPHLIQINRNSKSICINPLSSLCA